MTKKSYLCSFKKIFMLIKILDKEFRPYLSAQRIATEVERLAKEVEEALAQAVSKAGGEVSEFTVAPQVNPASGELPYHEWFIEFEKLPEDIETFANTLDQGLQAQNSYYKDLIEGKILQRLKITCVPKGTFVEYMKSQGKFGGQNKVQHLSNDRKIADNLKW